MLHSQIDITVFATQPGDCNGATGELRIEATSDAANGQYTFEVYKSSTDLSGAADFTSDPATFGEGDGFDNGSNEYKISGLINDTYTIRATKC